MPHRTRFFILVFGSFQGFLTRLASHILEWRNKDLIVHSLEEMLTQRVFQIAAGYEDADDCDALRHDKFIRSYKKVPTKIILDFDDSNSNTYGAQQLSLSAITIVSIAISFSEVMRCHTLPFQPSVKK